MGNTLVFLTIQSCFQVLSVHLSKKFSVAADRI